MDKVTSAKVSGVQLRESLRRWVIRRDLAADKFKDSLFVFSDEMKFPFDRAAEFTEADTNVAILQDAQQRYNQRNMIIVGSGKMTMSLAIKLVGGAGRYEKMWREAVKDTGRDRHSYGDDRSKRDTSSEYATKTVSDESALGLADSSSKRASDLRTGIAIGNAREIEISGLNPELL